MIASAQFTIISLCDVVTSDTPPENPYEGQLWVDTSVTPPETKIWDGNEWVVEWMRRAFPGLRSCVATGTIRQRGMHRRR